ncbi:MULTISPECIES: carbonate dehydratase [Anaeromyxobacter]|uniref:carbonate dehydratase n=1 Tax=Anaeromyxobacter TaxID=161492 RepID=UPI001F580246|nr:MULTISPECIES: carbonate dehydratase [unclassified Anaeromyxobacter]
MKTLQSCFEANRAWAARMREREPGFFERLVHAQKPELLWIGCSDSRLPPDQVVGRLPGEIFVHRNVANVVVHTDVNCLSVLQYGIEVLGVRHVIVCGHYGCGGVRAAMEATPLGLIDNWLRHIRDVYLVNRAELDAIADADAREDRLCELNVAAQVANVCHTTIVQGAWTRGQELTVHGWIYDLADGLLRDLDLTVDRAEQIPPMFRVR